jgi:hypothetical protein
VIDLPPASVVSNLDAACLSLGADQLTLLDYRTGEIRGRAPVDRRTLGSAWWGTRWIKAESAPNGAILRDALSGLPLFTIPHGTGAGGAVFSTVDGGLE